MATHAHFLIHGRWAEPTLRMAKRNAETWVRAFSRLEHGLWDAEKCVGEVECTFMEARSNQPFAWGDDVFTCAPRAVISLATKITFFISQVLTPGVVHILDVSQDDAEACDAACRRLAEVHGLLDRKGHAGKEWAAFCDRYCQIARDFAWPPRTVSKLQTALLLEGNGASLAPKSPPPAVQLRPDEFDFGGRVVNGFSVMQVTLLRLVRDAGNAGAKMPEVLKELGYKNTVKGRKAFGELRRRTQESMNDQKPPIDYLLEILHDHLCLTRNTD